ncbi:MAG TPA: dTMP kinase [Myxococcota bacterium]|jgi:dTMP kinase
MTAGRFIVLEGADGVGTTTQMRALADVLRARGRTVHTTAEPSTGPIGVLIRSTLKTRAHDEATRKELALLFAADRLHHYSQEVAPQLAAGVDVISDRYALSSLVYQSLELDIEWVATLNQFAPKPDACVLVTLPVAQALARLSARAERDLFETQPIQERVHARYGELAVRADALIVDGSGTVDEVTARIVRCLDGALGASW